MVLGLIVPTTISLGINTRERIKQLVMSRLKENLKEPYKSWIPMTILASWESRSVPFGTIRTRSGWLTECAWKQMVISWESFNSRQLVTLALLLVAMSKRSKTSEKFVMLDAQLWWTSWPVKIWIREVSTGTGFASNIEATAFNFAWMNQSQMLTRTSIAMTSLGQHSNCTI